MNKTFIAALVAGVVLAGCGTLSGPDAQGYTDNPVFPKLSENALAKGTYPNIDNVKLIETTLANEDAGMSRDQIYHLLDEPHHSEGFQVREWDYVFHFHTNNGVQTCQYKVLFDKNKLARNTYWQPESCRDLLDGQPAELQPFSLSGDVAFAFDSASLTPRGQDEVRKIAQALQSVPAIERITVSGHTDRLGSAAYNQNLSQRRANTVKQALAAQGIAASLIHAQGYGASQPVTTGCAQQNRDDLIACLAPDRRVDIEVQAKR